MADGEMDEGVGRGALVELKSGLDCVELADFVP